MVIYDYVKRKSGTKQHYDDFSNKIVYRQHHQHGGLNIRCESQLLDFLLIKFDNGNIDWSNLAITPK